MAIVVAYDLFDPTSNITITWDVVSWTPDGYVAVVKMNNYQMYRQITSPGWTLGWTWAKKEIIWSMVGAQADDQGECKEFQSNIPHSCEKNPRIIDMHVGAPYNQQFPNCCKGGIVTSLGQDPANSLAAFQLSVGNSGKTYRTVSLPKNFSLLGPNQGYTCSSVSIVPSSVSFSSDGRRKTRALMKLVLSKLSVLKFQEHTYRMVENLEPKPSDLVISRAVRRSPQSEGTATMKQCTQHMCPIRVHWHVKRNYKAFWRVRITITNFNYNLNYTKWTLVAQHPNLNNVATVNSFIYKPLLVYESIKKLENDLLLQAGSNGSVYSEMILRKDEKIFTLNHGWAFPRKVYFNGDECIMPLPVSYPSLPNSVLPVSDIRRLKSREMVFEAATIPVFKFSLWAILLFMFSSNSMAFDPLDPFGNITIKWDVIFWTADGYVATMTVNNFQMYRHIMSPGWTLGWNWAKKEVIWSMVGAQTTEQGDCSKFKGGNQPHCCKRNPVVVDLLPGVPYNQQISNCCKGGVVSSWGQDPSAAVSAFQVSVGLSGTSNKTVKLPKNFTLLAPGPGYTCGPATIVPSTVYLTPDRRRKTQALSK
ncbi:Glycosyl-phosphatidyl inositol-anchored, plant, partial [Cynara cardunculus var. scolymus]